MRHKMYGKKIGKRIFNGKQTGEYFVRALATFS